MYVKYSPKIKAQAINMRDRGKTVSVISKDLNISESTLFRWFRLYKTPQSITEEQAVKEAERLAAECQHLQNVVEIIHQSGYIKEIPLQRRLE